MPDWNQIAKEQLSRAKSKCALNDDYAKEIGSHLEDSYEELKQIGIPESEALARVIGDAEGWKDLALSLIEVQINPWAIWGPSLAIMASSMLWLMVLQKLDLNIDVRNWSAGSWALPYLLWLATLPAFGALGACLSEALGGGNRSARMSALSPAFAMFGAWTFLITISALTERNSFLTSHFVEALVMGSVVWSIPPAAFLFLGKSLYSKISSNCRFMGEPK